MDFHAANRGVTFNFDSMVGWGHVERGKHSKVGFSVYV